MKDEYVSPIRDKQCKVFVLVNVLSSVSSFVYGNHIEFFVWTKKHLPNVELHFWPPQRASIDNARNSAAVYALHSECDYLLFIDDDVLVPKNALETLLMADKDIVAGLVIIRGMPFNVMCFRWADETEEQVAQRILQQAPRAITYYNDIPLVGECKNGHSRFVTLCEDCENVPLQPIVDCEAVGFSCALIKSDILLAVPQPYFLTGKYHTEDVYFCRKAKALEPEPTIAFCTSIQCGHMLNAEPIEWRNRRKLGEFYERMGLGVLEEPKRNEEYLKRCIMNLG